jgi:hypothetical protein
MILNTISAICFGGAILHTFLVSRFRHMANKFPEGSIGENIFHLIGEVEVVFGVWSIFLLGAMLIYNGAYSTLSYLESRSFTEPAFVFVIMVVCSTKPILEIAARVILFISKMLPLPANISFYVAALVFGPILGSFITEPAAMTVTALLLLDRYFKASNSMRFKYATLALLFVNVSIGGTLTPFAAPPILMVARVWNFDLRHVFLNFGIKGVASCLISTFCVAYLFKDEFKKLKKRQNLSKFKNSKLGTWPSP